MTKIQSIKAREIIDSRGLPTLEGKLVLDNGQEVVSAVPAGTSIGKYEALELRDADPSRLRGLGVTKAVAIVNDLLAPKLVGVSPLKQKDVDYWLIKADGTKNKERLGANSTLLISQLFVKAAAVSEKIPVFSYINSFYTKSFKADLPVRKIPTPIFNIINGGKHANNDLQFQEFQILPSSSFSFEKSYLTGLEIFHELKEVLLYRNANISVGEEGGFTPDFSTNLDAVAIIAETINKRGLKLGVDIFLGLDIAASHFFKDDRYLLKDMTHPMNRDEYIEFLLTMLKTYAFLTLEDPLNQDDFDGWAQLNKKIPKDVYLVGDDLLATNKERLLRAIKEKSCTTILVKPNQIGTITETLEVVDTARKNNINYVVSHRSGETNDSFIADFAVGVQSDFVKFGAPSRGERVAKYNRLLQIEKEELQ